MVPKKPKYIEIEEDGQKVVYWQEYIKSRRKTKYKGVRKYGPYGPYWYAHYFKNGKPVKKKYIGKNLPEEILRKAQERESETEWVAIDIDIPQPEEEKPKEETIASIKDNIRDKIPRSMDDLKEMAVKLYKLHIDHELGLLPPELEKEYGDLRMILIAMGIPISAIDKALVMGPRALLEVILKFLRK